MGLNTIKRQLLIDEPMSGNFSTEWIDCLHLTSGSFSFVWSAGATPVGVNRIYISNEPTHSDEQELVLSDILAVSGASGVNIANLDVLPCRYVKLSYVWTSGDGTANVYFVGKGDAN